MCVCVWGGGGGGAAIILIGGDYLPPPLVALRPIYGAGADWTHTLAPLHQCVSSLSPRQLTIGSKHEKIHRHFFNRNLRPLVVKQKSTDPDHPSNLCPFLSPPPLSQPSLSRLVIISPPLILGIAVQTRPCPFFRSATPPKQRLF